MGSRDEHEGLACLHRSTGNNTSTSTRREPLPNSDRRGAGIGLPCPGGDGTIPSHDFRSSVSLLEGRQLYCHFPPFFRTLLL